MDVTEFPEIEKLVTLDEVRAAAGVLRGVARRTPLLMAGDTSLSGAGGMRLKCENLQRGGAFKLRGAYNFISRLPDSERARGVVTYSSGNHGKAVALAAKLLGVQAVVVIPVDAPRIKADGIERLGAEVVKEGTTSVERRRRAEKIARTRGAPIVPPFDHPLIVAGQGTVGLEIGEEWPDVERVVVPVGGGGLLAGIAASLSVLAPGARVYGVEPRGAAAMQRSLKAGEPVSLDSVDTVADGLKPVRPGDLTFAHAREQVADVVLVDDEDILRGVAWLAEEFRMVVEPSGGATVGALLAGALPDPDAPTVVVISGGNVDPGNWTEWVSEYGMREAGKA
ncbi:MAG: threonine/serine dehydratase [Gemmatimonadota bacterium]|nr:threonine/serine dehydratase [Candidatus Palauibacterales bacterium]